MTNDDDDLWFPKPGDRVRLIEMPDDPHPVPVGTEGTVEFIDGMKQIHVKWDNGSSLALIPEVDKWETLGTNEKKVVNFKGFNRYSG